MATVVELDRDQSRLTEFGDIGGGDHDDDVSSGLGNSLAKWFWGSSSGSGSSVSQPRRPGTPTYHPLSDVVANAATGTPHDGSPTKTDSPGRHSSPSVSSTTSRLDNSVREDSRSFEFFPKKWRNQEPFLFCVCNYPISPCRRLRAPTSN
jgi:hypothetical protein